MIKAIARGRAWFEEIATGEARSLQELAKREGISRRYIRRLVALAFFLSPQLIKAILQGRQSVALTTTRLTELARRDPPGFRHFMVSRPRKSGSHKTLRWRKADSNNRSRRERDARRERAAPIAVEQACGLKLEGIISKHADAPYAPGNRGLWLKVKCLNREEFVVVGWTDPEGARPFLGALLLAYYDSEGRLIYAGRAGTGIGHAELERLSRRLQPLATPRIAA
jgi:hypothetical protein